MSAGTKVDVYIDCNGSAGEECGIRFFGSQAGLLEGMTLRMVRAAARDKDWQTGVRRDNPARSGLRRSLMDFCPRHRTDGKTA